MPTSGPHHLQSRRARHRHRRAERRPVLPVGASDRHRSPPGERNSRSYSPHGAPQTLGTLAAPTPGVAGTSRARLPGAGGLSRCLPADRPRRSPCRGPERRGDDCRHRGRTARRHRPREPTRRRRDGGVPTPLRLRLRRGPRALRASQRALPGTPHRPLQPRHHHLDPARPAQQRDAGVEPPERPLLLAAGPPGDHPGRGGSLSRASGGGIPPGRSLAGTRPGRRGSALLPRRHRGARIRLGGDRGPRLVPRRPHHPARGAPPPAGPGTRSRLQGRLRGPRGLRLRDRHPAAPAADARLRVRDARRPGRGAARGGDHRERGPARALGGPLDLRAPDAARGAGGRGARGGPATEPAVPEESRFRSRRSQHPDGAGRFRGGARTRRGRSRTPRGRLRELPSRAPGVWWKRGSGRPSCSRSAGRRRRPS